MMPGDEGGGVMFVVTWSGVRHLCRHESPLVMPLCQAVPQGATLERIDPVWPEDLVPDLCPGCLAVLGDDQSGSTNQGSTG